MNRLVSKLTLRSLLVFLLIGVGAAGFIWILVFFKLDDQQFVHLADSFLNRRLYFSEIPSKNMGWGDTSLYNGRYYWPLGVFPALLLLPFVSVFGDGFMQVFVSIPLTLLSSFLLYKIAFKITKKREASVVLAFAYIFSSAYAVAAYFPLSWWFAHVVATSCLFLSIYFTYIKPHPIFSGVFFALSFLTRISLIFGILFFPLYYYFFDRKRFIKTLSSFLIPVMLGMLVFFSYNYLRFGNIFETGYKYQILIPEIAANREVGMWSIKHFPTNLYLFLLKGPDIVYEPGSLVFKDLIPDKWGMSFLLTSPIFLLIFLADFRKTLNKIAAASALAIALFIFGSFGTGAYQYGYRFALDFQPFLYLILADYFRERKMGGFIILFVFLSYVFNYCMILRFVIQF